MGFSMTSAISHQIHSKPMACLCFVLVMLTLVVPPSSSHAATAKRAPACPSWVLRRGWYPARSLFSLSPQSVFRTTALPPLIRQSKSPANFLNKQAHWFLLPNTDSGHTSVDLSCKHETLREAVQRNAALTFDLWLKCKQTYSCSQKACWHQCPPKWKHT